MQCLIKAYISKSITFRDMNKMHFNLPISSSEIKEVSLRLISSPLTSWWTLRRASSPHQTHSITIRCHWFKWQRSMVVAPKIIWLMAIRIRRRESKFAIQKPTYLIRMRSIQNPTLTSSLRSSMRKASSWPLQSHPLSLPTKNYRK